jgi:hypothetical protein
MELFASQSSDMAELKEISMLQRMTYIRMISALQKGVSILSAASHSLRLMRFCTNTILTANPFFVFAITEPWYRTIFSVHT